MKKPELFQDMIDSHKYWDMLLENLIIAEEFKRIQFSYTNDKRYTYVFENCYKVIFDHCLQYNRKSKTEESPPCFLRDINLKTIDQGVHGSLYVIVVDAYPIKLEIWCEKLIFQEDD
ncbi:hypothetical protein [Paenibacillus shenyangensis]|uniref:hypothetical protein n=1 Tax=Paenibacillus sp. A9 TaxID=1284352 RepID=UPI000366B247|nr:hypothetical protein [Paenibacillus sp. A9]